MAHFDSSVTLIWATKSLFWWLINSENSCQLHLKNQDFSLHYWTDLTQKIGCFNLRNNMWRHYSKLWKSKFLSWKYCSNIFFSISQWPSQVQWSNNPSCSSKESYSSRCLRLKLKLSFQNVAVVVIAWMGKVQRPIPLQVNVVTAVTVTEVNQSLYQHGQIRLENKSLDFPA